MKRLAYLILAAMLVMAAPLGPSPAMADLPAPSKQHLDIVHLGDSYSAGNGAGDYFGPPPCFRSSNNWGQEFANTLASRGIKYTYTNRACSGGTIQDLLNPRTLEWTKVGTVVALSEDGARARLNEDKACGVSPGDDDVIAVDYRLQQLSPGPAPKLFGYRCDITVAAQADAITPETDLVLLTMGGNDADFAKVVMSCFAQKAPRFVPYLTNGEHCRDAVAEARGSLREIMDDLEKRIDGLLKKKGEEGNSSFQILLSAYPLLSLDEDYSLPLKEGGDYPAAAEVRALGREAVAEQQRIVESLQATYGGRVRLLGSVPDVFAGHEPTPNFNKRGHNQRWINQISETEGHEENGKIKARLSPVFTNYFHPNQKGHKEWGRLVEAFGVSPAAPIIGSTSNKMDIVFVVDATESMSPHWTWTKLAIEASTAIYAQKDARFALVTYADDPNHGGGPGSYPARVEQGFTTNPQNIQAALNKVNLVPDGDEPETALSGIAEALNLNNKRPNAARTIVVIGNGPIKDPEPGTGLTWGLLRTAILAEGRARVSTIGPETLTNETATALSTSTGGHAITQENFENLPETIQNELEDAEQAPFAWLHGPHVHKIGDLVGFDASSSHANGQAEIVRYEFDLDGDGTFETGRPNDQTAKKYNKETIGHATVRITDSNGRSSTASTPLSITQDGDLIPNAYDNCPNDPNPDQQDINKNNIGDECEPLTNFNPPPNNPTPTPSQPPTPTKEPTPTPTKTPSPTPTKEPSPSTQPTPSKTPTPTNNPTTSQTPTPQPTPTTSQTPTLLPPPTTPRPPNPTPPPSPTLTPPTLTPTTTPTPTRPKPPSTPNTPTPPPTRPGPPNTGY